MMPFRALGLCSWVLLSPLYALAAEPSARAARDTHTAEPASTSNVSLGATFSVEPTPLFGITLQHDGSGLWNPRAQTVAAFDFAWLTGGDGYRLTLERDETLFRSSGLFVQAVLATSGSLGADRAARYQAWSALVGGQVLWALASWELGLRLAYLPTLVTHLDYSGAHRELYGDRYPDDRGTLGPTSSTLFLSAQRWQLLLLARTHFADGWQAQVRAGLQPGLFAGKERFNLFFGQMPIILRVGLARSL